MTQNFTTVADAITWGKRAFKEAGLFYGHGTDNAWDEAAALVLHVLDLPPEINEDILRGTLSTDAYAKVMQLFQRRIEEKIPSAYLMHQTWFCGLPFYVDKRVIIPRSPIAELIEEQFVPWVEPTHVHNILDLCCGSACIGIACAYAFPQAHIDAVDISSDALEVAAINVEQYQLQQQVSLIQSDLFTNVPAKEYDLIISNPPYVDAEDFNSMPAEYQHEPALALESGNDGLDATRIILQKAGKFLSATGVLVVEVGNSAPALEAAFPDLEFMWLEFENGGDGVFMLTKAQLDAWQNA